MEKFRHFGDAATGIHPFTFVITPTTLGKVGATCMFPMRLLFCAVFVVLLLLTDTLLWLFHCLYLGLLGRLLLGPLQRAWLRGLLFFIGHILPEQPPTIAQPQRSTSSSNSNNSASPRRVRAGDLIVCNLQSVWDVAVLEVMLTQPYHAVCFPDATAEAGSGVCAGLRVFWPGPLQRWSVWQHIRRTGTLDFLNAQLPGSEATNAVEKKTGGVLPLYQVQEAAARAGLSVWWFGEGTCSNGKGLLTMPAVTCRSSSTPAVGSTATPSPSSAGECAAYVATIQYDTPAVQTVVGSDVVGLFGLLFQTGVLLYGSAAPAWSSPFFPTAEVTFRAVRLTRAVAASDAAASAKASPAATLHWTLSAPALLELRNAMCQRGQALVVSGSSSSGGGAAVRRQPLSVGVKEKKGFVEAYISMVRKG